MCYGLLESILDYKFLSEIGTNIGEFSSYEELFSEVRLGYKKYGIIFVSGIERNKYYYGVHEISRREAMKRIKLTLGLEISLERYFEET